MKCKPGTRKVGNRCLTIQISSEARAAMLGASRAGKEAAGKGIIRDSRGRTITVTNVNVPLLRQQRNWLLKNTKHQTKREEADGLINLLDDMLDIAEGYKPY
jgi:hypothetical protein